MPAATQGQQQSQQPNTLGIWGDDIGTWNISHNSRGMMGYMTPSSDRIAKEGVAFVERVTDPGPPGLRTRTRTHRHVRQRRQAVGRAAHILPGSVSG
jgi:hypothetical protein